MSKAAAVIGPRIKELRENAGLTQDGLAEVVGVGAGQVVSRWERGLQVPRLDTAMAIAAALGVKVDALTGDDVEVHANPSGTRDRVRRLLNELPDGQVDAILALVKKLLEADAAAAKRA